VLKESVHALTNNKYQFDTDKIKQLLLRTAKLIASGFIFSLSVFLRLLNLGLRFFLTIDNR
jgi:hypothetical protein